MADASVVRAIGWADGLDVRAAFEAAVRQAEEEAPDHPDALLKFKVLEIGAEVGGIAGTTRTSMKVEARSDET